MDSVKTEANSSSRAHDQETQTNFEPNSEIPNGTLMPHRPTPPVERRGGISFRNPASWGRRHPLNLLNTYPDYYPYDARYASMLPLPPAAPHGSDYFPSRSSPWCHYNSSLSLHSPRMMSHSSLHRYGGYPHMSMVPPGIASPHNPIRHMDVDIARPKPEWPPGYRPVSKPPVPSEYLAAMHRGNSCEFSGPPSTATSLRSTVLDFPMPQSFRSPRGSAQLSRKRALSNTPSSVESIDLNALIRTSPDSLLGYLNGMRSSSAGSFGHLSPVPFCTSPGTRPGVPHPHCDIHPPFITPPPIPSLELPTHPRVKDTLPSSTTEPDSAKEELATKLGIKDGKSPQESSSKLEADTSKDVAIDVCPLDSTTSPGASDSKTVQGASDNEVEEGDEQDLACHWKDCSECTENQEELVRHVNVDHIKKEKKDFTCYWQGCSRGQKPFKAQYMLVVHMRRHTGEKPHKCSYKDCSKAYSRLENLKTHLRSHTGERPYVCEVEGCTKAFSNASDRAKHQNRTHSSVKPYVCKVPNCPKRYTDPSSLRKHTKTVHGEQGIKKLKSEGSKPSNNQERKQPAPPEKAPNHQLSNTSQNANNPMIYGQSGGKSPGRESVNSSGAHLTHGTVSCESELVSSSCDTASFPLDIPGNQDTLGGLSLSASHPTLSPRSPSPFIKNLPDILESDWEPGSGGNVMAEQVVAIRPQTQSVTLPKIETYSRDVAKWVSDVHRRMSEETRRSSEASHLSADTVENNASRRSSESGWASYNDSRRSSQASPFPQKNIQPVIVPHPPNTHPSQYGVSPLANWPNVHPLDRTDTSLRRGSDISTGSYLSSNYNRPSRTSSGYGSQSNLALIRGNQIFHKCSPPARSPAPMRGCNRRQSDTVICEADSSSGYLSNGGKKELRRSSEPARHLGSISPRHKPTVNQSLPVDNLNASGLQERELISNDFDPAVDPDELDAYLSPQQPEELDLNSEVQPASMQVPQQTQRLRHYPYAAEGRQYNQHQPRLEAASQTIHHRPSTQRQPLPSAHVPHQHMQHQEMSPVRNPVQEPVQPSLWHQQDQLQQKLCSYQQQQEQQEEPQQQHPQQGMYPEQGYMDPGYNVQLEGYRGDSRDASHPSYEELMVSGMGALSTENDRAAAQDFLGNGNMVVSDMNSLLTSLLEEDKYLEMKQTASRVSGSAMSIF